MASNDYASAIPGGLKLKDAKPTGVTKKKKKTAKTPTPNSGSDDAHAQAGLAKSALADGTLAVEGVDERAGGVGEGKLGDLDGDDERDYEPGSKKTEAERRYEEMRRKRLNERLQKEGPKTHKQRVEELNKYLSTLSEHHDMPRIGPG